MIASMPIMLFEFIFPAYIAQNLSSILGKHSKYFAHLMQIQAYICIQFIIQSLFRMQKKVGIRLRHLQGPSQNRQQIATRQAPQQRTRERSQSPLGRRKIFAQNYPQNQYQAPQPVLDQGPPPQQRTYQIRYNTESASRPYSPISSPIMNQPLNSNNSLSMSDNIEYESEVERLIESLKKKTVELEKKEQLISKLNLQIDMLRNQNGQYLAEIKMLRAQIQAERIQRTSHANVQKSNISERKYSPTSSQSYQNRAPGRQPQSYQNQPYEQLAPVRKQPVIHVKLNPTKLNTIGEQQVKSNRQTQAQNYNGRNQYEPKYQDVYHYEDNNQNRKRGRSEFDQSREQDSVLSDYLSPLMVLNNKDTMSQSAHTNAKDHKNRYDDSRFEIKKESSRDEYTQKYQPNSYTGSLKNNANAQASRGGENPFAKKPAQAYQKQILQFDPPAMSETFGRNLQYQAPQPKYSTLESSAGHFNMNVKQSFPPSFPTFSKNMGHKQLAIQDSKQFRFEDFDFSELDNSAANSQF